VAEASALVVDADALVAETGLPSSWKPTPSRRKPRCPRGENLYALVAETSLPSWRKPCCPRAEASAVAVDPNALVPEANTFAAEAMLPS
jgi:hypothetical protein